jgi:hypothetical protein
VLVDALMEIDPQYPRVSDEQRRVLLEAKRELEAEAPGGEPADPNPEHAGREV